MRKKFINASIYKYDEASEILVENGKFKAFGKNLGEADEVIDLEGLATICRCASSSRLLFYRTRHSNQKHIWDVI